MKNYRHLGRMHPDEWEDDEDWKARRLDFIWDVMTNRNSLYIELGLNDEKYDFYKINDTEVSRLASKYHYSADYDYYRKYYNWNSMLMAKEYYQLNQLRLNDLIEFLKKCNSNKFDFLQNHFDCFQEEYAEYKRGLCY